MLRGLYVAHTGLRNEQNRMDILTNNLANASTVGYKKEGSTSQAFSDVLAVKIKDQSVGLGNTTVIGGNHLGVKIGENYVDYSQGSFRVTDNTYDLGLSGKGFFALEFTNSQGETSVKYTRAGDFTLTTEGYLVNNDGAFLLDENSRRIQLNTLVDTRIDENGTIFQEDTEVATIQVADFDNYDYLKKYGETFFEPVEGATMKPGDAKVIQGTLEMSNIQVVNEMVNLISITRAYETNQKIMQTYDESLGITVGQLGKLQ